MKRATPSKCIECDAPIKPERIGYCEKCFEAWLRTIDKERVTP
jgi:hypothetical protein